MYNNATKIKGVEANPEALNNNWIYIVGVLQLARRIDAHCTGGQSIDRLWKSILILLNEQ